MTRTALFVFSALLTAGCDTASKGAAKPDPVAAPIVTKETTPPACKPWGARGFSLVVRNQAGMRADFFREITFDDATGVLAVHDSDPFAGGGEAAKARVIQRSITLSSADHESIASKLSAICPSPKAFADECAPGGCSSLRVTSAGSEVKLESVDVVRSVFAVVEPFFPELRGPK